MEQLEMAVESGDVKELEEAIAAGQSALRHSSLSVPLSVSDTDRDKLKSNKRELEHKITVAKKLFVSNLERCKVYIKALRRATRSRNYKMVKEALQMAHTAPNPVQRFMWNDIQAAEELLGKLTKVRVETRQVLKCRKWQEIDNFLNEHAELLDDRTILALVQTREDLIRAEKQNNKYRVEDKDAHTTSHGHAEQMNDRTKSSKDMVRSPRLHSVRVPSSAHHTASLHNKPNGNSRRRVDKNNNNNNIDDVDDRGIIQGKSVHTRHPQTLVKTYTLPYTEPESYLPLHNKLNYATNDEMLHTTSGLKAKSLQQKSQEYEQQQYYVSQWHDKLTQNNNQPNFHVTENINEEYSHHFNKERPMTHNKSKESCSKEDCAAKSEYKYLQARNNTRNNNNIGSNDNDNRSLTKYELYNQEEDERENIAKEEMHQRSTIYEDEMMEFAPPCLRNNVVLACKERSQERRSEYDSINNVIRSELKSPVYLNNITMYRTLPVLRYSNTFDISPDEKHSFAYQQ